MRTFTLVIGSFNLEVEEDQITNLYSAKCKKVGFNVENHLSIESILFPFCLYLEKKHLTYQRDPSKLIYKGFTLEIEYYHRRIYGGDCKEINFKEEGRLDDLVDTFLYKVDNYLEVKTMKAQFSVVYKGFTLEVWQKQVIETTLWFGKCEAINFKEESGFHYLDTLVGFFQGRVDELSKPTKIEYRGYKLEITKEERRNALFVGTSDISNQWRVERVIKENVIETFKQDVDSTISFHIKNLELAVVEKQEKLEEYLRTQEYVFDVPVLRGNHYYLYAIHPDYYKEWKLDSGKDFPEGKVVFIKKQTS